MHADKPYIGKIPIILPNESDEDIIQSYVDKLFKIEDKFSNEFNDIYDKLNKKVFEIYGLTNEEVNIIENTLKGMMSKKHG